jgi:hypothetical protein
VFGHLNEVDDKKIAVTKEATEIKEQMLGYVDAIIKRQDKYDVLKKVETFQVETASRHSLKELVTHYQLMYNKALGKIDDVKEDFKTTSDKYQVQQA